MREIRTSGLTREREATGPLSTLLFIRGKKTGFSYFPTQNLEKMEFNNSA